MKEDQQRLAVRGWIFIIAGVTTASAAVLLGLNWLSAVFLEPSLAAVAGKALLNLKEPAVIVLLFSFGSSLVAKGHWWLMEGERRSIWRYNTQILGDLIEEIGPKEKLELIYYEPERLQQEPRRARIVKRSASDKTSA